MLKKIKLSSPARAKERSAIARIVAADCPGRPTEAERICHQFLAVWPDHFDTRHSLGVFLQRGNHAEALHQIELAVKQSPGLASTIAASLLTN